MIPLSASGSWAHSPEHLLPEDWLLPGLCKPCLLGSNGRGLRGGEGTLGKEGKAGEGPEPPAEGDCARNLWEGFPGGWGLGLRLGAACSDLSGLLGLGPVWRLQAAHRTQKE